MRIIDLLPELRVVMLLGRSAHDGWGRLTRQYPEIVAVRGLHVIKTYHTSNQAFWHPYQKFERIGGRIYVSLSMMLQIVCEILSQGRAQ